MMCRRFYAVIGFIFFLLPAFVCAAESNGQSIVYANPVGASQLVTVIFGLIAVLSLIFALAWLYQKYGNVKAFNRSDIKILGGVSLGSREKALLLEVEGERLLVGIASGHITTLHAFGKKSVDSNEKVSSQSFAGHLADEQEKN